MQSILPIIITTWDALTSAAAEQYPLIYVDEGFYRTCPGDIGETLRIQGYVLSWKKGKKGVFFLLAAGEKRFDHSRHQIHDPLDIL